MRYTIKQLAQMAGLSTRTLRYYDEIGLLKPKREYSTGYRVYDGHDVDRLQQILFYKTMGVALDQIIRILTDQKFDPLEALKTHRDNLLLKKNQLNELLNTVEQSIAEKEGKLTMKPEEKFKGLVDRLIEENEAKYGEEIREKFGAQNVERSNQAFKNMSEETYNAMEKLGADIIEALDQAVNTVLPTSEKAQHIAQMHKQWLSYAWGYYNKEAHAGLVQMYVEDERFKSYYDVNGPGRAELLRDAVLEMIKEG